LRVPGPPTHARCAPRPSQGFDPSHAPFLHDGLLGIAMANNLPMDAEALPPAKAVADPARGFTWRHGAYSKEWVLRARRGSDDGDTGALGDWPQAHTPRRRASLLFPCSAAHDSLTLAPPRRCCLSAAGMKGVRVFEAPNQF
jgi:hypothetical protein